MIRVLLIAGFLDEEVRRQEIFKKDSRVFLKLIRLFGLPTRVGLLTDNAPWIRNMISFMETQEDIELHVFGPQIRLKKKLTVYESRGVTYYFHSCEWTSLLRKTNSYFLWKKLQFSGLYFRKVLKRVNPDLVVLSGTENPATSVSVFYADKYPRYCLCQTIYNNPERSKYGTPNKLIQDLEKDIISTLHYFGVYSKMHYELLKKMNPNSIIFKFGYPSKEELLLDPTETEKQFDFVNFALMHGSRKGTPDSILALGIVKQKHPNITLNIVGGFDDAGLIETKQMVRDLGLAENVIFTPFFESRDDLLKHIQKSRFAVLPCKMDHTSGTMAQAMQLGLPLVVYKTTGTPAFNREQECVLIANNGNIEELAQHMLTLMEHPDRAEKLAINAREYQIRQVEEKRHNGDRLMAGIRAIVDHYRIGTPIPKELLFDIETD